MRNNGFTLLELLVVVIIVGIIATIGLVNYTNIKEEALNKEAQALLRLVHTAEKTYHLEIDSYANCASNNACNSLLGLQLPTSSSRAWDYTVTGASGNAFCTQASRVGGSKTWRMRHNEDAPVEDATCP
jgi:prepilin-type N-terminal cleavage/methylation domain-containing protein